MAAHASHSLAGWTEKVFGNSVPRRARGSFGEIAGVIGLLPAIGIGAFLHALRVIIISAITATPCCLEQKIAGQLSGNLEKECISKVNVASGKGIRQIRGMYGPEKT